ncbi:hypothetical protein [Bradyrhizobium sp.]|uniref:hypothetical protein n=1 Tax=Bradyrhizobium sp. TaxID=376 RepID=UPI0025BECC3A|nr:hypothetical protein [Bradyrhizobium sp.]
MMEPMARRVCVVVHNSLNFCRRRFQAKFSAGLPHLQLYTTTNSRQGGEPAHLTANDVRHARETSLERFMRCEKIRIGVATPASGH